MDRVKMKSSDKMWSTGRGNGNPFQYSCLENPMDSMKRQKDTTLDDETPPGWKVSSMLLGKGGGQFQKKMKQLGQSGNGAQLWMCLVVKVKPSATKNNVA